MSVSGAKGWDATQGAMGDADISYMVGEGDEGEGDGDGDDECKAEDLAVAVVYDRSMAARNWEDPKGLAQARAQAQEEGREMSESQEAEAEEQIQGELLPGHLNKNKRHACSFPDQPPAAS